MVCFFYESLCISEGMLAEVKDVLPKSIFLITLSTFNSNHIPHKYISLNSILNLFCNGMLVLYIGYVLVKILRLI